MNEEAAALLGLKDFGAFCRGREGASTIRTLLELSGRRVASGPMAGVIECTVRADAFCHSMVRSLVGALVAVATGRRDHEWLAEVMERARTRLHDHGDAGARTDSGGGRLSG